MATAPRATPIVSSTQTPSTTITGATLAHNVTSNKQVRATIKAHKALLKSPQARTIPWRQILDTEKAKLRKLREYYIAADEAYHRDEIDIPDVLTFWDLNEEHYYAVKRWRQLKERYNSNWDSEGNPIMDQDPAKTNVEDSDSDTDDDSESEEESQADGEESEDVTGSEPEPQSVHEHEGNQPAVHRSRPRRRRGVVHRARPMTPIEE
jgi:hypothetical protein